MRAYELMTIFRPELAESDVRGEKNHGWLKSRAAR